MHAPRNIRNTLLAAVLSAMAPATFAQSSLQTGIESVLQAEAARSTVGNATSTHTISRPAQVRYELGAVVDVRQADAAGPRVVAITPGGAAERIGLRPGDRLLRVNGVKLANATDLAVRLPAAVAKDGGRLEIAGTRGGQALALSGEADAMGIPAYKLVIGEAATGSCGYVSSRDLPPRSKQLYPATITRIDGRSTSGSANTDRFGLSAGRHVLTVAENLDRAHMSTSQVTQIAKLQHFTFAPTYKSLVVDIKPGYHYRIASRLVPDRMNAAGIRANAYWEPVVWAKRAENCH